MNPPFQKSRWYLVQNHVLKSSPSIRSNSNVDVVIKLALRPTPTDEHEGTPNDCIAVMQSARIPRVNLGCWIS